MALTQASIDQLKKHLEEGQFANAEDMNALKQLINYEVNLRRKQGYKLTTEIMQTNKQFDTAAYINNLIGGLRKIHKTKFSLVTQNITFIKALFDLIEKIEKLMSYKDQTKYGDNAGCDGECRGLCSGCEGCCTGANSCAFVANSGNGGNICTFSDSGVCSGYQMVYKYTMSREEGGNLYFIFDGTNYVQIDGAGKKTGFTLPSTQKSVLSTTTMAEALNDTGLNNLYSNIIKLAKSDPSVYRALTGSATGYQSGCSQNGCSGNYGGTGCSQTASGWDYGATTSSGCSFNGACGAKNYSH